MKILALVSILSLRWCAPLEPVPGVPSFPPILGTPPRTSQP
jgi:hypothetical protein